MGSRLALVAAVIGCGSPSAPEPAPSAILTLGPAHLVPWTKLSVQTVDVGPPTGGAFELPGPRVRPVRPLLELGASPAGVAARVVQGDGVTASAALAGGAVVPLPEAPLAVAPRTDGVWAMYRDRVAHHDASGAERARAAVSGIALIGADANAAWVVGLEQLWHVGAGGAVSGPYPWRGLHAPFADGARLCASDPQQRTELTCVQPTGASAAVPLPFELQPLEQVLALAGDRTVTLQGTTLRVRRGAAVDGEWLIRAAGLDAAGRPFAVTTAQGQDTLWREGAAPRVLPGAGPRAITDVAVDGDAVTLYGQGQATALRDPASAPAAPAPPAPIDEAAYRATIFPRTWQLATVRGIALGARGTIYLAASGPTGAAIVELQLPGR